MFKLGYCVNLSRDDAYLFKRLAQNANPASIPYLTVYYPKTEIFPVNQRINITCLYHVT